MEDYRSVISFNEILSEIGEETEFSIITQLDKLKILLDNYLNVVCPGLCLVEHVSGVEMSGKKQLFFLIFSVAYITLWYPHRVIIAGRKEASNCVVYDHVIAKAPKWELSHNHNAGYFLKTALALFS